MLPKQNKANDSVPMFHEWATVQPGMLTLARKKRTAQYRQFHAAETAMPVIACAECLGPEDEKNFFFSGVCRSKSVRGPGMSRPSLSDARCQLRLTIPLPRAQTTAWARPSTSSSP